jgi:hypothetical protein
VRSSLLFLPCLSYPKGCCLRQLDQVIRRNLFSRHAWTELCHHDAGAKRQRTFRLPEDSEGMLYGAREPDSARLQSEASLPGVQMHPFGYWQSGHKPSFAELTLSLIFPIARDCSMLKCRLLGRFGPEAAQRSGQGPESARSLSEAAGGCRLLGSCEGEPC